MDAKTRFQSLLTDTGRSALSRYREITYGRGGWLGFLSFEMVTTLVGPTPGLLGIALRRLLYRPFLGGIGAGTVIGRGVAIRNPRAIRLGRRVVVDDQVVLDAKGAEEVGIRVGDEVVISRNTVLSCKGGTITIGDGTNIAMNCLFHAGAAVSVARHVLIASYCYLVGVANHRFERTDVPIIAQGEAESLGITVGMGAWLGARVTVLDGANVGEGAVVGAGSVVTTSIPAYGVAVGTPAKVVRSRQAADGE
jgi:acetyltransferase-like isoleucine patch superfamily enzyme